MRIHWSSRQGTQRKSNNDAVTIGQLGHLLVCLLIDAAERTPCSQHFARQWGLQVVPKVLEVWQGESKPVLALLSAEQSVLRNRFLLELASYSLLCLDEQTSMYQVFQVGDCMAGEHQGNDLVWWTQPHTLAQSSADQRDPDTRHLLTRSLNARRFCPPEVHTRDLSPGTQLIMATDGYWVECLQDGKLPGNCHDDASYLQIEPGNATFSHDSDTENFHRIEQPGNPA